MEKKKILIIGGSSFFSINFIKELYQDYKIIGSYFSKKTLKINKTKINVANKNAYGIDRFITNKPKAIGARILLACIVAVLVVTACSKYFLGTTFAVNADLDGFPNTNVIESIPVAKYICHGTKIFLNDKIVSIERTIKLND